MKRQKHHCPDCGQMIAAQGMPGHRKVHQGTERFVAKETTIVISEKVATKLINYALEQLTEKN